MSVDGVALVPLAPRADAAVRLFCLPYAGGSAVAFRAWPGELPPTVELVAIELPGRTSPDARRARRVSEVVAAVAHAMRDALDRPFAVFGHSLGALLGFELVRELRRRGAPQPFHLFVGARPAPHVARPPGGASTLSDAELVERLRQLNGTPPELLENAELMRLVLPALRADVALLDTYTYADEPPLDCPITVFGGAEDPLVRRADLEAWRRHTASLASVLVLPGDHFFVRSSARALLEVVGGQLVPPVMV